jgi:hypothetical protein
MKRLEDDNNNKKLLQYLLLLCFAHSVEQSPTAVGESTDGGEEWAGLSLRRRLLVRY